MSTRGDGAGTGVYVHVPFCASRCDYCDFATWTDRAHLVDDYVDACVRHVRQLPLARVDTVFFGGGTPSLLPAAQLVSILDAIPRAADAEVTVECNPDSVDDWADTLDAALALGPGHVSAYGLTVEAGTPLGKAVAAGTRAAPDDDDQALKYELVDDRLTAAGMPWYEVSNWARPGEECRHNLLYWHGGDYAAVGCAAHGAGGGRRWWNVRTPERYVAAITAGDSPEAGGEALDADERLGEALVLELRTAWGIKLPVPMADPSPVDSCLDDLAAAGLLDRVDGRAVLTRRGRLLGNEVAVRLLEALDRPSARVGTR
jgi:coproporphyrinogen III oxidase-like Fe-S oxidoreductase